MRTAAKTVTRAAIVACVVACGSQGPDSIGNEFPGGFAYVGSGGGGGFEGSSPSDGGGEAASTATDGGHEAPPVDGGSSAGDDAGIFDSGTNVPPLSDAASTEDGGSSVGVTFSIPPGFFPSLAWTIAGPAGHYAGTVFFGDAHSFEFVVGGIQAGAGYTLTLTGTDIYGQPCSGTSAPFAVAPGTLSGAGVQIECAAGDASSTSVTTGSVDVDAGVTITQP